MTHARFQFGLRAMFWSIATISLALAYLRTLGEGAMVAGLIVVSGSAVLGGLIGLAVHRPADVCYWTVLGAVFAFLSSILIVDFHLAWACTGAVAGATVGASASGRPLRTMIAGALAAGAALGLYAGCLSPSIFSQAKFDLFCAPLAGLLFGALVEVFFWLEQRSRLPRYVSAAVLMSAVCLGNFLAR